MVKCQICNKHEARYKIKIIRTGDILFIDEWCEPEFSFETIEELKSDEIKLERTSKFGRLHLVKNPRLQSTCFVCKRIIEKGEVCYNQKEQIEGMPFPLQRRICFLPCGEQKIKEGCEVAI